MAFVPTTFNIFKMNENFIDMMIRLKILGLVNPQYFNIDCKICK